MKKDSAGSTWVSIGTGASTFQVKAPEAQADRPWTFEGMTIVEPGDLTVPSSQLAVGPIADARALESPHPDANAFRWSELGEVDVAHLALLRCVEEGIDPNAPVDPFHEERSPFTRELVRRTIMHRTLESSEVIVDGNIVSFEMVGAMAADGDSFDALVLRLPPAFVGRLAQLSEPATNDLARRWARAWSELGEPARRGSQPLTEDLALRTLDALVTAGKAAIAATHDVFVWMPG